MRMSSSDGNAFEAMLASIRRSAEERASERGFATVDAMAAADDAEEARLAKVEHDRRMAEHRESVISAVRDELPDDAREALRAWRFDETHAIRVVREWAAMRTPVLSLAGRTGTGKSFAALVHACSKPTDFQIVRAARLGAHWERWSSDREDRIEPLRLGVPLLIIDDLGLEPLDDRRAAVAVEELFHARQSSHVRTIVTTNLTPEEAKRRYSERVFSRLSKTGQWTHLSGTDLRRRR